MTSHTLTNATLTVDGVEVPVGEVSLTKSDPKDNPFEWLARTGWKPGELSAIISPVFSSVSKSVFRDLYMQVPRITEIAKTERAAGARGLAVLLDEMDLVNDWWVNDWWVNDLPAGPTPYLDDIRAEYRNSEHPEADTLVVLEKLDKKDPRHPNPAAGDSRHWFVKQGLKKVQVKNLTMGKRLAEKMHKQSIADIDKARADAALQARLAQKEAERLAAENEAQLKAHPGFGGF